MALSDSITRYILSMLDEDDTAELRRNEIAQQFGCAPSQVNYVISTRFNPDMGYYVQSRRGGGGYIRITRIKLDSDNRKMNMVAALGDEIDEQTARAFVLNLYQNDLISQEVAKVMTASMTERALCDIPVDTRAKVRARIFKNMLINI